MRRKRMHGRRRVRRSPMKHLSEDGTLLKAENTEQEESEEASTTVAKEEVGKESSVGKTVEDVAKERENALEESEHGQHTHAENNSGGILQSPNNTGNWWKRTFGL